MEIKTIYIACKENIYFIVNNIDVVAIVTIKVFKITCFINCKMDTFKSLLVINSLANKLVIDKVILI